MFDLAYIPPVTELQQSRYEFLVQYSQINRSSNGPKAIERTSLIFLMQSHMFKRLITEHSNSIAVPEYNRLAVDNYNAYLRYISK